jgi:hypothetical protein
MTQEVGSSWSILSIIMQTGIGGNGQCYAARSMQWQDSHRRDPSALQPCSHLYSNTLVKSGIILSRLMS